MKHNMCQPYYGAVSASAHYKPGTKCTLVQERLVLTELWGNGPLRGSKEAVGYRGFFVVDDAWQFRFAGSNLNGSQPYLFR
jgi:hypothetical protein